jgi:hypothetical protein
MMNLPSLIKGKIMAGQNVWVKCGKVLNLTPPVTGATTAVAQATAYKDSPFATFQAYGTTTAGGGTVTVLIQGSNIDLDAAFITIGTITLTLGTTVTSDGFVTSAPWKYVRANVSAISGTGASVNVLMGV